MVTTLRQYNGNNISYAASSMAITQTHNNKRRASVSQLLRRLSAHLDFRKIIPE